MHCHFFIVPRPPFDLGALGPDLLELRDYDLLEQLAYETHQHDV
jgi:hypothetical protein